MYTHNYFHVALFHLDKGNLKEAFALFDERIWLAGPDQQQNVIFPKNDKKNMQDQLAAIDLLWKLEIRNKNYTTEGEEVIRREEFDQRWKNLAGYVISRTDQHYDPLFDLLVLHTLGRSGHKDIAGKMVEGMEKHAGNTPLPRRQDLEEVWLPLAKAVIASNDQNFAETARMLQGLLERFHIVGGSLEQREVLQEMYLDSLLAQGAATLRDAKEFLNRKIEERDCVVWFHQNLAVVEAKLAQQQ